MAQSIAEDSPARLFRSRAWSREEMTETNAEQIGDGRFDKMVRLALTDPDYEVWRYSITTACHTIEGDAIRTYAVTR